MRKIKIVADSSADVLSLDGVDFAAAPLKIITDEREFIDDAQLDVTEMVTYLYGYKGASRSSCPNSTDWLSAFGDADDIFCVTITSGLSGSYNAAYAAKQIYESEHEGGRVFVLDSLSAGPELRLLIDKICEWIAAGRSYEEICADIQAYQAETGLLFLLKSLKNFANNGRISPLLAKVVGFAGICIVGRASAEGTLEPIDKCRGESRALERAVERLLEAGLSHGRVCLSHCQNEAGAMQLKERILERCPHARVDVFECRGLCSFYVERGGILMGFEKK